MSTVLDLDGADGDGGGQILRSALSLSLISGTAFRLRRLRAKRSKPGLQHPHLAAVQAAARIGGARVHGAQLGATELLFQPGTVAAGHYEVRLGAAESATLVLQAILAPLLAADGPSTLVLEGATHHPSAPTPEFLEKAYVPCLRAMGAGVSIAVERPGFAPSGGGRLVATVTPGAAGLAPFALLERGAPRHRRATVLVAGASAAASERETAILTERLGLRHGEAQEENLGFDVGAGNAVLVELAFDAVTAIVSAVLSRGHSPDGAAHDVCAEAEAYLATDAPIGPHLADQLLVPMAIAGGGTFRTVSPTHHTLTTAELVRQFFGIETTFMDEGKGTHRIEMGAPRHRHR